MKDFPEWAHARDWANCQHSNPNTRHYGTRAKIYKSNSRWCVSFDGLFHTYVVPEPSKPELSGKNTMNKYPEINDGQFAIIETEFGDRIAQRRIDLIDSSPSWFVIGDEREIYDDQITAATEVVILRNGREWEEES